MEKSSNGKRDQQTPKKRKVENELDDTMAEPSLSLDLYNLSTDSDSDSSIRACENADFLQDEVDAIEKIPGVIKDAIVLIVGDSGAGKSLLASTFSPIPRKPVSRYTKTVVDLANTLNRPRCYLGLHIFCAPFRKGNDDCFLRDPLDNPLYDLVIFLFDITKLQSLQSITEKWYPEVKRYLCKRLPPFLVVGNKLDRVPSATAVSSAKKNRMAFYHEGEACASAIGAHRYFEVSALIEQNINLLMEKALNLIC